MVEEEFTTSPPCLQNVTRASLSLSFSARRRRAANRQIRLCRRPRLALALAHKPRSACARKRFAHPQYTFDIAHLLFCFPSPTSRARSKKTLACFFFQNTPSSLASARESKNNTGPRGATTHLARSPRDDVWRARACSGSSSGCCGQRRRRALAVVARRRRRRPGASPSSQPPPGAPDQQGRQRLGGSSSSRRPRGGPPAATAGVGRAGVGRRPGAQRRRAPVAAGHDDPHQRQRQRQRPRQKSRPPVAPPAVAPRRPRDPPRHHGQGHRRRRARHLRRPPHRPPRGARPGRRRARGLGRRQRRGGAGRVRGVGLPPRPGGRVVGGRRVADARGAAAPGRRRGRLLAAVVLGLVGARARGRRGVFGGRGRKRARQQQRRRRRRRRPHAAAGRLPAAVRVPGSGRNDPPLSF